jgi:hypothetical protein
VNHIFIFSLRNYSEIEKYNNAYSVTTHYGINRFGIFGSVTCAGTGIYKGCTNVGGAQHALIEGESTESAGGSDCILKGGCAS